MNAWLKKYWQFIVGILVASLILNFAVDFVLRKIAELKDHSVSIEEDQRRHRK